MAMRQAELSVSNPQEYRENLFARLGNRHPLDILAQTPAALADVVNQHPAAVLRSRPYEGKWSPNEIIGHLADGEWVGGYRLRLVCCEDRPTILGMHQDLWVARLQHNDRDPSELAAIFRTLRELNLSVWKRMSPTDLERVGHHNQRGPESLAEMLRMLAGHDLSHLDQISRLIRAVQQHD